MTVLGNAAFQLRLTDGIVDHTHNTGGVVVHEVDIHAVTVAGGHQAAGLRIALGGRGIGHCPAGQIQHRDVVAAVGSELALRTRHAHIGAAVIHHGSGSAHAAQRNGLGLCGIDLAVGANDLAVEVTALGGKVHAAILVSDVGADIAHITSLGIDQLAGILIEHQQVRGGDIGALSAAVVGTDDRVLIVDVSTGPVEAALAGIAPHGFLGFLGLVGSFIVHRQAHEVGVLRLTVPEACIDAAVGIGDGTVGLTAQRVGIQPQGFQCGGVKRLHAAVGQAHEDHAVGIGRRHDAEAGGAHHAAAGLDRAGVGVHLDDLGACVSVHIAAHQDGRADRVGVIARTGLAAPQNLHIIVLADGGLGADDGHALVIAAEVGPLCVVLCSLVGLDGLQRHVQHAVGQVGGAGQGAGLGDIALGHHGVTVVRALAQAVNAVFVRRLGHAVGVGNDHVGSDIGLDLGGIVAGPHQAEGVRRAGDGLIRAAHLDGEALHGAVHRHVRGVGVQLTVGVLHRTGKLHRAGNDGAARFTVGGEADVDALRRGGQVQGILGDGLGLIDVTAGFHRHTGGRHLHIVQSGSEVQVHGIGRGLNLGALRRRHRKDQGVLALMQQIEAADELTGAYQIVGNGHIDRIIFIDGYLYGGVLHRRDRPDIELRIDHAVPAVDVVGQRILLEVRRRQQQLLLAGGAGIVALDLERHQALAAGRLGQRDLIGLGGTVLGGHGIGHRALGEVRGLAAGGGHGGIRADGDGGGDSRHIHIIGDHAGDGARRLVNGHVQLADLEGRQLLVIVLLLRYAGDDRVAAVGILAVSSPDRIGQLLGEILLQLRQEFLALQFLGGLAHRSLDGAGAAGVELADGVQGLGQIEVVLDIILLPLDIAYHSARGDIPVAGIGAGDRAGGVAVGHGHALILPHQTAHAGGVRDDGAGVVAALDHAASAHRAGDTACAGHCHVKGIRRRQGAGGVDRAAVGAADDLNELGSIAGAGSNDAAHIAAAGDVAVVVAVHDQVRTGRTDNAADPARAGGTVVSGRLLVAGHAAVVGAAPDGSRAARGANDAAALRAVHVDIDGGIAAAILNGGAVRHGHHRGGKGLCPDGAGAVHGDVLYCALRHRAEQALSDGVQIVHHQVADLEIAAVIGALEGIVGVDPGASVGRLRTANGRPGNAGHVDILGLLIELAGRILDHGALGHLIEGQRAVHDIGVSLRTGTLEGIGLFGHREADGQGDGVALCSLSRGQDQLGVGGIHAGALGRKGQRAGERRRAAGPRAAVRRGDHDLRRGEGGGHQDIHLVGKADGGVFQIQRTRIALVAVLQRQDDAVAVLCLQRPVRDLRLAAGLPGGIKCDIGICLRLGKRKANRLLRRPVLECRLSDGRDGGGDHQLRDPGAARKGGAADRRHGLRDHQPGQSLAVLESVGRNRRRSLGQRHLGQARAAGQDGIGDLLHAIGEHELRQARAAVEGGAANGLDRGRDRDRRQAGTTIKRAAADGLQCTGKLELRQCTVAGKRAAADAGHRVRYGHGFRLQVPESIAADTGDARADHNVLYRGIVHILPAGVLRRCIVRHSARTADGQRLGRGVIGPCDLILVRGAAAAAGLRHILLGVFHRHVGTAAARPSGICQSIFPQEVALRLVDNDLTGRVCEHIAANLGQAIRQFDGVKGNTVERIYVNGLQAGGQRHLCQFHFALIKCTVADLLHAVAQLDLGQRRVLIKGVGAYVGHAFADDHLGKRLRIPSCLFDIYRVVIRHRAAAADGQGRGVRVIRPDHVTVDRAAVFVRGPCHRRQQAERHHKRQQQRQQPMGLVASHVVFLLLCILYLKRRSVIKESGRITPPVSSRWVCDKRGGGRGGFSPPTLMES